jgi:hypothetical protein
MLPTRKATPINTGIIKMKTNLETQTFTRRQALITLATGAVSLVSMNAFAKTPRHKGNSANAFTNEEPMTESTKPKPFVLSF